MLGNVQSEVLTAKSVMQVTNVCERPNWSYDETDAAMVISSLGTYQKKFIGIPLDEAMKGVDVFRPMRTPLLLMASWVAALVVESGVSGWRPTPIQNVHTPAASVSRWDRTIAR
jgi:hypothetical protein